MDDLSVPSAGTGYVRFWTYPDDVVEVASVAHDAYAAMRIPLDPRNVSAARRFVHDTCEAWTYPVELCETAMTVVSELVTNAFTHGRSDVELCLREHGDRLRVEVRDEDSRLPAPGPPDEDALGGRGLSLVSAVVDAWGAERVSNGKCVWAEMSWAQG